MKEFKEYVSTINEASKEQIEYKVKIIQDFLSKKGVFDDKSTTLIADKTGSGYQLVIMNNANGGEKNFGGDRGKYTPKEFLIFLDAVIAAYEENKNPAKF